MISKLKNTFFKVQKKCKSCTKCRCFHLCKYQNKVALYIMLIIIFIFIITIVFSGLLGIKISITLQFILIISTIISSLLSLNESKKSTDLSRRLLEKEMTDPLKVIKIVENNHPKSESSLVREDNADGKFQRKWVLFARNVNYYKTIDKVKINYVKLLKDYNPIKTFNYSIDETNDCEGFQKAEYIMYPNEDAKNEYRIRIYLYFNNKQSVEEFDSFVKNKRGELFLIELEIETVSINGAKSKYILSVLCNEFVSENNTIISKAEWSYSKSAEN